MKNGNKFDNKKVLIVGLGKSGIAALEVLLELGACVAIQDSKPAEEIDGETMALIKDKKIEAWFGTVPQNMGAFELLVLSPGVPVNLSFIQEARDAGAEIIGELELAYRIGRGRYVGITGTNGKTTTTTLVGEIFKAAGRDTSVVGNIGSPVVREAARAHDDSWLVTEISSFQLETADEFRPEVSAILNLTPDHLDRHGNMENYGAAKARIFARQEKDDFCVLNYDDEEVMKLGEECKAVVVPFSRETSLDFGAYVKDEEIIVKDLDGDTVICRTDELKIPGSHNLENALAAVAIAWFSGIDEKTIAQVLREFAGVEHRIENCGSIDGVRFINDSKGTNTDAAIKAIEAMKENIILIAGGYDKHADYTEFISRFPGRVKHMVLLGQTAEKIRDAAVKQGFTDLEICKDMADCVDKAWEKAQPGDIILLSPACASWDMYKSYEKRGEDFKECVRRLRLLAETI